MTSRFLLYLGLALIVSKLIFRFKFRELGARLDRGVTLMLVLIVVAYGAQVVWWLVQGR